MKKRAFDRLSASTKKTYNDLSLSLLRSMEEKPFEKISTIDICQFADVPRATFYNHFEDKYDLLRYALKEILNNIAQNLNDSINLSEYPLKLADEILKFILTNEKYAKKIVYANYKGVLFNEIKNAVFELLCESLTAKELYNKKYSANKAIIAEFYANGIVYSAKTWIENGMNIPKEEVIESLKTILAASS